MDSPGTTNSIHASGNVSAPPTAPSGHQQTPPMSGALHTEAQASSSASGPLPVLDWQPSSGPALTLPSGPAPTTEQSTPPSTHLPPPTPGSQSSLVSPGDSTSQEHPRRRSEAVGQAIRTDIPGLAATTISESPVEDSVDEAAFRRGSSRPEGPDPRAPSSLSRHGNFIPGDSLPRGRTSQVTILADSRSDARRPQRSSSAEPTPGPSVSIEEPHSRVLLREGRSARDRHSDFIPRQPEEIEIRSSAPPRIFASPSPFNGPTATAPPPPPKPASVYRQNSGRPRSELDWIIPVADPKQGREPRPRSLEERLRPTIEVAKVERDQCKAKAQLTGYALNGAIGLQVVFGALTTGLSAALSGHKVSIMTAVLGGMSTIVASYLARVRGSNEPERSLSRSKDLDGFIRECEIFVLDYGHITSSEYDPKLKELRERLEDLLGNVNRNLSATANVNMQ
ncbi:SLATT-fungal domain-containing protein [Mycena kentingensis (nom. inval.)]|nr:SLATT-fungal domain-containing protein [Mycena kentingensis (nom. inval.)]